MAYTVWIQFLILFSCLNYGLCVTAENGEEYIAGFSRDVGSCADFDNDFLNFDDLELTEVEDDSYEGAGLMAIGGSMLLSSNIQDGLVLCLDVVRITDNGDKDPIFSTSMAICDAIRDKDAPWSSIIEAMHIDGCPVEAGTRDVDDVTIDLSFAEDFLNDHYTGDYECTVMLLDQQKDMMSCHTLGLSVIEV